MLKRIAMLLIPVIILIVVFAPIGRGILYWSLFALMFVLVYLVHIMEDLVPIKDVISKLGTSEFWSIKCGYIKSSGNQADLLKGLLVIYSGQVLFYRREKSTGGAKLVYSFEVSAIEGYTIEKVDDFHPGISFNVGEESIKFTSKNFSKRENELRKALGWPEEAKATTP